MRNDIAVFLIGSICFTGCFLPKSTFLVESESENGDLNEAFIDNNSIKSLASGEVLWNDQNCFQ